MYNFRRAVQPAAATLTATAGPEPQQEEVAVPVAEEPPVPGDGDRTTGPLATSTAAAPLEGDHVAGLAQAPHEQGSDVQLAQRKANEALQQDASEESVLLYYRSLVQRHSITPPRAWRQIRFDLPATVAELRLYPPTPEPVQYEEPVQPSPCLVLQLEGCVPAEMSTKEYCTQMVQYLFDLLKYQSASTAMTTLRFVKRGAELAQLVVTFAKDVRLATRILVQLQEAGISAGYGQPIEEYPPNATFQLVDYRMTMHGGQGITVADIHTLLAPFRQSRSDDMSVIEGFEPGVFYAAVKRPETVYAFLWNPFCSYVLQSELFERYGVLLTMALCAHEFLAKGVPYYIQKRQKELEKTRGLRAVQRGAKTDMAGGVESSYHTAGSNGDSDNDAVNDDEDDEDEDDDGARLDELERGEEGDAIEPAWAQDAEEEVDIFAPIAAPRGGGAGGAVVAEADVEQLLESFRAAKSSRYAAPPTEDDTALPPPPAYMTAVERLHLAGPEWAPEPAPGAPFGRYEGGGYDAGPYMAPPPPRTNLPALVDDEDEEESEQQQQQQQQLQQRRVDAGVKGGMRGGNYDGVMPAPTTHAAQREEPWRASASGAVPYTAVPRSRQGVARTRGTGDAGMTALSWSMVDGAPEPPYGGHVPSIMPPPRAPPFNTTVSAVGAPQGILGQVGVCCDENLAAQNGAVLEAPVVTSILPVPPPALLAPPADARAAVPMTAPEAAVPVFASLPAPMLPTAILPSPPQQRHVQLPLLPSDALRLAHVIEGHTQAAFPREFAVHAARYATSQHPASPLDAVRSVLECVPAASAHVPRATAAIDELTALLAREHDKLSRLLQCREPLLAEARHRIAQALLVAPLVPGRDDWRLVSGEGLVVADASATPAAKEGSVVNDEEDEDEERRLPALLPYLLTSHEGTELVACLMTKDFAPTALPLLCRYVGPFLLDIGVIQSVCVAALRDDAGADNVLVTCLLRHWVTLARWLRDLVVAETRRERARDGTAVTTADVVARRLLSHVGNAADCLLAGLSRTQREACAGFAQATQSLQAFVQMAAGAADATSTIHTSSSATPQLTALWAVDEGAVWRTLLRFYVNADILDGSQLAHTLFAAGVPLTREQYYFVMTTLAPCQVSATLSVQTAALCGCFLRRMEMQDVAVGKASGDAAKLVLDEEAAMQLLEGALRARPSRSAYEALREAYYTMPVPRARSRRVAARLQSWPGARSAILATPLPAASRDSVLGAAAATTTTSTAATSTTAALPSKTWQPEWTAAMSGYPAAGPPFAPLPPGWTSALSRSYGHYYFKPPAEPDAVKAGAMKASYRHPTEGREFMATPQAFLIDAGATVTLTAVLAHARQGITAAAASNAPEQETSIGDAEADVWLRDQRIRHLYLDTAVLELLAISYRVGGRTRTEKTRTRSSSRRGRSRSRRHADGGRHERRSHSRDRQSRVERLLEARLAHYPATGAPFPALPTGWTVSMDRDLGYYTFRAPAARGEQAARRPHPKTGRRYLVSPQAFASQRGLTARALADAARVNVAEVDRWFSDQRRRRREVDDAVLRLLNVHYQCHSDEDDVEEGRTGEGKRSRAASDSREIHSRRSRGGRRRR